MTDTELREKARAVAARCYGNKLSEIEEVVAAALKEVAEEAGTRKFNEGYDKAWDQIKATPMSKAEETLAETLVELHDVKAKLAAYESATRDSPEMKEVENFLHAHTDYCNCREVLYRAYRSTLVRIKELEDMQFSPGGDNHHNAFKCPYCNPSREEHGAELTAALVKLAEKENNTLRTDGGIWDKSVYRGRAEQAEAKLVEAEKDHQSLFSRMEGYLESAAEYEMAWFSEKQRAESGEAKLASAKAFHRNICDLAGWSHDEKDWLRDLACVEESLRSKLVDLEGHKAGEAALNMMADELSAKLAAMTRERDSINEQASKLTGQLYESTTTILAFRQPVGDEEEREALEGIKRGDFTDFANRVGLIERSLCAKTAALKEAEEKVAASVPRSRYDVACAQYNDCERERKRLFDALRALEKKPYDGPHNQFDGNGRKRKTT